MRDLVLLLAVLSATVTFSALLLAALAWWGDLGDESEDDDGWRPLP